MNNNIHSDLESINNKLGLRIRDRCEISLSEFMQLNTRWMIAKARYYLFNNQDAEEAVNDAFRKIWFKSEYWDINKGQFHGWINTLFKNTLIDYHRKNTNYNEKKAVLMDPLFGLMSIPDNIKYNNVDIAIINNELGDIIESEILKLDQKNRIVCVLRFLEGYSVKDIAKILNIKDGTVKIRLYRSKIRLKPILEDILILNEVV